MNRPRGWSRWKQFQQWWRADDGRVTAFVVVLTIGILALAGLTLDGGLALAAKVKANGQAEAAARAGAQAVDLAAYRDTGALRLVADQAITMAERYLATAGGSGIAMVSGNTVTVRVTSSQRTQLLGVVGIESLAIHGQGNASPQRGVVAVGP